MAYVHCHNCDFSQDDYWCESYNPIRWLLNWEKDLLSQKLDEVPDWSEGNKPWRELLALELERKAESIRTMIYRTHEEYRERNPKQICPKCNQKELDVD
jgi:hypothetical protein